MPVAVVQVSDQTKPVIWVLVSAYLCADRDLLAAMLGDQHARRGSSC